MELRDIAAVTLTVCALSMVVMEGVSRRRALLGRPRFDWWRRAAPAVLALGCLAAVTAVAATLF